MKYTKYDMNAYNLHIIKTDKFKTITIGIAFRGKIKKEEITIRNLLKEFMLNATYDYPTEKALITEIENLYDLKLMSQNYRVGNYSILTFKTRFLNEKYTEPGMNKESIKFLLDLIFKPKLDIDMDKCKEKIRKSILSLSDNKVKYALHKLLETTGDMPYAYNSYGYIDDLEKITYENIDNYYHSVIKNDVVDVYVVGDVFDSEIKSIFKEYFKVSTYHKQDNKIVVNELDNVRKVNEYKEQSDVFQSQVTILYGLHDITDRERRFVLPVFTEMLGGTSNSILFDRVREKKSYAYYVNSIVKSYDNILMVYAGTAKENEDNVYKMIDKAIKEISKNNFSDDKFNSAKKTLVNSIKTSLDSPIGIMSNYYAMELVGSPTAPERIKAIESITREEIVNVSKKVKRHTKFILEAMDEKDNHKED